MKNTIKSIFSINSKNDNEGINISLERLLYMRKYANKSIISNKGRVVKSALSGGYKSKIRGRGLDFEEVREYSINDNLKDIDWKVTARLSKPYTKIYNEEKELSVYIVIDLRSNMNFGTKNKLKSYLASEIASVIGWSALANNDKIGAFIINNNGMVKIPAHRSKNSLSMIFSKVIDFQSANGDNTQFSLSKGLLELRKILKTGSLVYVLSDLIDFNDDCKRSLKYITSHNNVKLMLINDVVELNSPEFGSYNIVEKVSSEANLIKSDNDYWRANYNNIAQNRISSLLEFSKSHNIRVYQINNNMDMKEVVKTITR